MFSNFVIRYITITQNREIAINGKNIQLNIAFTERQYESVVLSLLL